MTRRYSWLLGSALVAAFLLTGLFAVRAVQHARDLRRHTDEPIRPWMNVPYIAHAYHVPPHILFQALGLPPAPPDSRPISGIARQQGRTIEDLTTTLMEAILHARPPTHRRAPPRAPRHGVRHESQ